MNCFFVQLETAREDLEFARTAEDVHKEEICDLKRRLDEASDLEDMAARCRTVGPIATIIAVFHRFFFCHFQMMLVSGVPLLMLFLAMVMMGFRFFSAITGTYEPDDITE